MTVYADEAFLLNGAVDYLLLVCAAKLGGGRILRLRLALAAAFGGVYAAAALFPALAFLRQLPVKLASLAAMLLIAFGVGRGTLRTGALFFAAVCAFGGAAVAAAQLFGTGVLVLPGGTFYAVSGLGLLLLAGILYALCYTVFACTVQHGGEIRTLRLRLGGRSVQVRALHDTGCTLRDPMTGERVLVAEAGPGRPGGAAAAAQNARPRASRAPFELSERRHAGGAAALPALRSTGRDRGAEALPCSLFSDARVGRRKLSCIDRRRDRMKLELVLQKLGLIQPGKIMYIGGSDVLPAPLRPEDERRAIEALAAGDETARQTLIEHNLRLVVYIARRFENTGVNLEDLISIGTIGLIKAVNTFRPDRNIKLATYSSRCIENEILMHIRKIANQKTEVSLDEPINTDWDGNELLLSDVLGTDGDIVMRPLEDDVDHQLLRQALGRLPEREKQIVSMRFGLGGRREKTQKEVADLMGISQSYISRLEKRIMLRLRREISRQICS